MRKYALILTEDEAVALHNLLAELDYWEGLPDAATEVRLKLKRLLAPRTVPATWSGQLRLQKQRAAANPNSLEEASA
jgi:hypothetical protein